MAAALNRNWQLKLLCLYGHCLLNKSKLRAHRVNPSFFCNCSLGVLAIQNFLLQSLCSVWGTLECNDWTYIPIWRNRFNSDRWIQMLKRHPKGCSFRSICLINSTTIPQSVRLHLYFGLTFLEIQIMSVYGWLFRRRRSWSVSTTNCSNSFIVFHKLLNWGLFRHRVPEVEPSSDASAKC